MGAVIDHPAKPKRKDQAKEIDIDLFKFVGDRIVSGYGIQRVIEKCLYGILFYTYMSFGLTRGTRMIEANRRKVLKYCAKLGYADNERWRFGIRL